MDSWSIFEKISNKNGLIAGSTIKDSSCSYDFSLATHTGEDRLKIYNNRKLFLKRFPNDFKAVSVNQIHSNIVINIDKYDLKNGWNELDINADGMVSSQAKTILTIFSADCLALLAFDSINKIIGAAHAGWRGVNSNIAKNLIENMEAIGAKRENIFFALSPSIKGCCYEVGEDVAKHFLDYKEAIYKKENKKYMLDISIVQKEKLLELGIDNKNIEVSPICTSCNSSKFFSYRKECGCSGRFATFIAKK